MKNLLVLRSLGVVGLLIFTAFAGIKTAEAQNPLVKQWDYRFGGTQDDQLYIFRQTSDGGFILGGTTNSSIGGDKTQGAWGASDYWIVKTDSLGIKQWDKDFGGTNNEALLSLQQTSDGGYILGGYSSSGISGVKTQPTWGVSDYWIVKTDSLGIKQWDKDFGGINYDYLYSVYQTTDGGYILGGSSYSDSSGDKTQPSQGEYDNWIIKTDSLGNKQWDRDFGGIESDYLYAMQKTADKGYILVSSSYSDIGGDKTQTNWGITDYWIVKTDSLGIKQWDKDFGGIDNDEPFSVQQTLDGGYIFEGASHSGISGNKTQPNWGGYDYWIVKTNSLGIKQWEKDFGGTNADEGVGNIFLTADRGYLCVGTSYSSISGDKTENNLGPEQTWVVKTDSLGDKQWDKTLRTNSVQHDETTFAIQSNDGCFVMANGTDGGIGGDKTQASRGTYDHWIVKFCDSTLTTTVPVVQHQAEGSLTVYPNPAEEFVVVSYESGVRGSEFGDKKEIEIYDLFGRRVLNSAFSIQHSTFRIDISTLSPGIYFVKAGNEVRKFVKQ